MNSNLNYFELKDVDFTNMIHHYSKNTQGSKSIINLCKGHRGLTKIDTEGGS